MVKNYLITAFRNLLKYKSITFINISGLAIGMTCCILILVYVQYELSYDRFHPDADRLFRVVWSSENPQTRTPHPMAQAMVAEFPEVESAVSISPIWGPALTRPKIPLRYGEKRFEEPGVYSADSTFFEVFSFPLKQGNPRTALKEPLGIVITAEMAQKYFGSVDPLGKTLKVGEEETEFHVTGVMENIPANSHFHFDFLISYVTLKYRETGEYYTWADFGHYNYVRLKKGADAGTVEVKIPVWVPKYLDWPPEGIEELQQGRIGFRLQPLSDIHLFSKLRWELEANSDIAYIYIFSATAFFILLLACINFVNLATARSSKRVREVGMRKVLGGTRGQLVGQFLGESLLISLISLLLSLALIELLLPPFNAFTGKPLAIHYFSSAAVLAGLGGIILLVGILAGIYPAFYLSAFQPVYVLKGKLPGKFSNVTFRRVLVAAQFVIAITLIAGTGIVSSQLTYLRHKNLGFEPQQVLVIPLKNNDSLRERCEAIKGELLQYPGILAASAVSNVPGERFNQNPVHWPSDSAGRQVEVSEARVDPDFFQTLGIEIAAGRGFSKEYPSDVENAFMLNETAARQFGWENAVGQELIWYDDEVTRRAAVIGVVKDFHFQSLHKNIEPLLFQVMPSEFNYLLVKISAGQVSGALSFMETKWKAFDPNSSFEYSFLDEDFSRLYRAEERMESIFSAFTLLTLFIACLGLFGLVSFMVEQRTREIGIRKVLGASVSGLVLLFSKEFALLILAANIIAWPLAFFSMNRWLQDFAYRIDIGWQIFALAGALALFIALLTVSYQAIRAAIANPVESLRYE
jgi:putative ABC transport system permease protein